MDWAKSRKIALDFNPTYFAHSKSADGFTLSSSDEGVRKFWVKHGIASRKIAAAMGKAQGGVCVNNHWVPDGLNLSGQLPSGQGDGAGCVVIGKQSKIRCLQPDGRHDSASGASWNAYHPGERQSHGGGAVSLKRVSSLRTFFGNP
jgi:hypothetical protein